MCLHNSKINKEILMQHVVHKITVKFQENKSLDKSIIRRYY